MKITIVTTKGGVKIADLEASNALDLAEALKLEGFMQINLDGESTVLLNPAHLVRVDIDPGD